MTQTLVQEFGQVQANPVALGQEITIPYCPCQFSSPLFAVSKASLCRRRFRVLLIARIFC